MSVMYTEMKGKVALITGGGGGIGRAVGMKLGESGAKIFVADAFQEPIDKAVAELKAAGIEACGYKVDVRDEADMQTMVDTCVNELGALDYLVTCAGIYTHSLLEEMSFQTWKDTVDINLTGTFLAVQKAAQVMLKNGFGRIVLLGSQSGVRGSKLHVHYGATKGGTITIARAFMREVADRNIRINCVCPGSIETPMINDVTPERKKEWLSAIPLGRFGTGTDVAKVIAFLLSDESDYMTGQTINVTGGGIVNT